MIVLVLNESELLLQDADRQECSLRAGRECGCVGAGGDGGVAWEWR